MTLLLVHKVHKVEPSVHKVHKVIDPSGRLVYGSFTADGFCPKNFTTLWTLWTFDSLSLLEQGHESRGDRCFEFHLFPRDRMGEMKFEGV